MNFGLCWLKSLYQSKVSKRPQTACISIAMNVVTEWCSFFPSIERMDYSVIGYHSETIKFNKSRSFIKQTALQTFLSTANDTNTFAIFIGDTTTTTSTSTIRGTSAISEIIECEFSEIEANKKFYILLFARVFTWYKNNTWNVNWVLFNSN